MGATQDGQHICDGTLGKCPLRKEIAEMMKEVIEDSGTSSMVSARCAGHEELRDLVISARGDIKNLSETLNKYIERKDAEDEKQTAAIDYLRMNGAKISQDNAADIKVIYGKLRCIEGKHQGEVEVEKWYDTTVGRIAIVLGIVVAGLGILGTLVDLAMRLHLFGM